MTVVVFAVATGAGMIVSVNEVLAGGQAPPSDTVMVMVTTPPTVLSFVPKVYVGVVLFPLVNVPSPLEVQEMVPFVAVYPPGILKLFALPQTVLVVVVPADAVGKRLIVRKN